jgi:hypothetical protein
VTLLTNSFESGTNGTTITTGNSGGASGNAFDVTEASGTSILVYSNTQAAHGSLSAEFANNGDGANSVSWSTSLGTQTQVWFRAYVYFTANPSVTLSSLIIFWNASVVASLSLNQRHAGIQERS